MKASEPRRAPTTAELTIATPEGVLFRLPVAGPAPRLCAMHLDPALVVTAGNGLGYLVDWSFAMAGGFGAMTITLVGIQRSGFALWRAAGGFVEWANDDWETPVSFARNG